MDSIIDAELKPALEALQNQDPEKAVSLLTLVLERDPPAPAASRMLAYGLLAPAQATLGQIQSARASVAEAIALAEQAEDAASLAHYSRLRDQLSAIAMSEDAIEQTLDKAMAALDRGDGREAENHLRTVLIAALGNQQPDLEATARGMLAQSMMMRGAPEEAVEHLERAVVLARAMGDAGAEQHFTSLLEACADPGAADRFRLQGDVSKRADAAAQHADAALEKGDWESVVSAIEPIAEEARALEAFETEATLRGVLSQAYLTGGKRAEAATHAKRAVAIAEGAGATEAADAFRSLLQLAVGFGVPVEEA